MDLISQLVSQLGVDRNAAEGAVGGVLAAVKEQAAGPEADAVLAKVPEAEGWMGKAQALAGGSGGGLGAALGGGGFGGALGGLAGALGGGGAGGLAALTGVLGKLGIGADKLGVVLPLVVQFLQARAGNELVGKLLAKVPFLAQAGGGGGLGGALGGLFGGR